jgi:hypothetical protein
MKKIALLFFVCFVTYLVLDSLEQSQAKVSTGFKPNPTGIQAPAYDGDPTHYLGGDAVFHPWNSTLFSGVWPVNKGGTGYNGSSGNNPYNVLNWLANVVSPQHGDMLMYATNLNRWVQIPKGDEGDIWITSGGQPGWGGIPAAGGVKVSGTPVNGQLAGWTDANTIKGLVVGSNLTNNGTTVNVANNITVTNINTVTVNGDNFNFNGGGNVSSGTYTPTATAINNCTVSPAPSSGHWLRIGNEVTVTGVITYTPNNNPAQLTDFTLSLPVASNLSINAQLSGVGATPYTATAPNTTSTVQIVPDTVGDTAHFVFANQGGAGSSHDITFTFVYTAGL